MATIGTPGQQDTDGFTYTRKRQKQEMLSEGYGLYVPPYIGELFFYGKICHIQLFNVTLLIYIQNCFIQGSSQVRHISERGATQITMGSLVAQVDAGRKNHNKGTRSLSNQPGTQGSTVGNVS